MAKKTTAPDAAFAVVKPADETKVRLVLNVEPLLKARIKREAAKHDITATEFSVQAIEFALKHM